MINWGCRRAAEGELRFCGLTPARVPRHDVAASCQRRRKISDMEVRFERCPGLHDYAKSSRSEVGQDG